MSTDLLNSSSTSSWNINDSSSSQPDPYDLASTSSLNTTASSSVQPLATGGNLAVSILNASGVVESITPNRMVFGTVAGEVRTPKYLRLQNTGSGPLTINGFSLGDSREKDNAVRILDHQRAADFQLLNAPTQPVNIQPGGALDIAVQFAPQRRAQLSTTSTTHTFNGENYASLTIGSNDIGQQNRTIDLAGLNTANYEANNEPALAEIARTFGWTLNVGTESNILGGQKTWLGDEVYSPYWVRADSTKPVQLFPLAVYSGRTDGPHDYVRFEAKPGSGGRGGLIHQLAGRLDDDNLPGSNDISGGENQKLLPQILVNGVNTSPTASNVSFVPNSPFALLRSTTATNNVGAWTDDNQNAPEQLHNWRIYPIRNALGTLIPHAWFATADPGNRVAGTGKNFDYNDNVYLMLNAKPESSALDPSVGGRFPGSPDLLFYFNKAYGGVFPNGLTDQDGQNIGFTSTQPNKNDTFTSRTSYVPSLVNLDTSGPGTLKITTTAGSNGARDNTLVNGVQTLFDGRVGRSAISTKLLGPFNNINSGFEQAGLMLGPDQDNFVKLVAIARNDGQLGLQFYRENKGVGRTIGTGAIAPGISSLELKLFNNPQAGTVRAGYRVGNNNFVMLPGTVTLKGGQIGHYFAAQSKTGLLTSNKGGSPFTATFDNFLITSNETTAQRQVLRRIDVGNNSSYTSPSGIVWSSDAGLFSPSNAVQESTLGTPDIKNTTIDPLYRSYRAKIGNGSIPLASRLLSFNIPVQNGKVDLRLHFSENYWGAPNRGPGGVGRRVFDVAVENQTLLHNFDITAAAGGALTAVRVPIEGVQVNDGVLNIQLKADADFGALSGIEVFRSA